MQQLPPLPISPAFAGPMSFAAGKPLRRHWRMQSALDLLTAQPETL
jgi:hypothetical protein